MADLKDMVPTETLGGWITLTKYCEISGETRQSVHVRVATGKWQRGVHYSRPDGGSSWINVPAVLAWLGVDVEEATAPEEAPPPVDAPPVAGFGGLPQEAAQSAVKPTFKTWLAESMDIPGEYANSVGTDRLLPNGGLGPITREPGSAKQFLLKEDCEKWCQNNTDIMFMAVEVELEYPS